MLDFSASKKMEKCIQNSIFQVAPQNRESPDFLTFNFREILQNKFFDLNFPRKKSCQGFRANESLRYFVEFCKKIFFEIDQLHYWIYLFQN